MSDRTDAPGQLPAVPTNLTERIHRLERLLLSVSRNVNVLTGAEIERVCAGFTPDHLAAVHAAASAEADRIAAEVGQ